MTRASGQSGPINGRLEDRALPVLLVELADRQATGVLRIDARAGRHELWQRDGHPVAVTLPGSAELIGKVLVEMGFLDETAHRASLSAPPPQGQRYGDMLIEKKLVTVDQMRLALKAQVRRKLHRLFFLADGVFAFEELEHQQGVFKNEALKVQPGRAIYQGVRSAWTAERLANSLFLLSGQAFRCRLSSDELVRYGLGAHDAQIGELLRQGYYTTDSLAQATKAPQQPLLSLLYALYVTNGLETRPANSVKVESAPVTFSSAPSREKVPTPTSTTVTRNSSGNFPAQRTPVSAAADMRKTSGSFAAVSGGGSATDLLRHRVREKAKVVEKEDLFQVLGLADNAPIDQVKNAYFELAKMYHPDRVSTQGLDSQRAEIELIFRRINEAYSTLSDETKRAQFLQQRKDGVFNVEDQAKALRMLEADNAFRRGEVFLRKNDLNSALREFTEATSKNPQEGEYLAYHTWTKLCLNQLKHAEAKPLFTQSIKLAPKCGRAQYYLGICLKEEGDLDRALSAFQKAVQLDSRLIEAEREARLINMRRGDKPKGFFDKLRGR